MSIKKTEQDDTALSSYDFELPKHLIATEPLLPKENAKLLVYRHGEVIHTTFKYLFDYIPKHYVIVLNNTRVLHARLFAKKLMWESWHTTQNLIDSLAPKEREVFYHKPLSPHKHLVQIRGRIKAGDALVLWHEGEAIILFVCGLRDDGYREIAFFRYDEYMRHGAPKEECALTQERVFALLQKCGTIPLPPYMKRESRIEDSSNYQSIFAQHDGSVAAPTASLHFSESMFAHLQQHYKHAFVTLHIGAGTFQPVSSENILNHQIHTESCMIAKNEAQKIMQANSVLCVGTTAMRSVEWLAQMVRKNPSLLQEECTQDSRSYTHNCDEKDFLQKPMPHTLQIPQSYPQGQQANDCISGDNAIFLHPHNPPQKVRALLTNFHLPKSSLLVLVSSLIGRTQTMRIYEEAMRHEYRFYSYGDGMLILE